MAKAGISTGASKIGNETYRRPTASPDALMEYSTAVGTLPILYPAGFRHSVKTPPSPRSRNAPHNALFKSAGKCTMLCTGIFSRNVITFMLLSSCCPCRQDITHRFFVFFPFLIFLSLRSLSPVSNFFYLFLLFSILLPFFPDLS